MTSIHPKEALHHALHNDHMGRVSADDARTIVDAAIAAVAEADDPVAVYEVGRRIVEEARLSKGVDNAIERILDGYRNRALSALNSRLNLLMGGTLLPIDAQRAFSTFALDHGVAPAGALSFTHIEGSKSEGYSFTWRTPGGARGKANALLTTSGWFFSDKIVTPAQVERARALFLDHFDNKVAPRYRSTFEMTDDELAVVREAIRPVRALFDTETPDPRDLVSRYSLVVIFENPTKTNDTFYLAFNPLTDENEAYVAG